MLRLFVALPLPDDIADAVQKTQSGLERAAWSKRDNLHITLRFVGEVDETQATDLDFALADIRSAPFELALQGSGFFGHDKPHAAWMGVAPNEALNQLQRACERACRQVGLAPDRRAYTPHVTTCYLQNGHDLEAVLAYQARHHLFKAGPWTADRFYLYASHLSKKGSSLYSVEAEYPLIG